MKKLREIQVEDLFNHKILVYIYFVVVTAFMHIASFEFYGDDNAVRNVLWDNIWEEIKHLDEICVGWSARYIINPFIHIMMHFEYKVWFVLEMIFFVLIFQLIKKHVIKSDRVSHLFILAAMMCTLTFLDYYEIGWIVSTITYIWVSLAFMVSCTTIIKYQKDEPIKWYQAIGYIILTVFAENKEEITVMGMIIFAVAIFMSVKNKKKYALLIVQFCIAAINFLSHLVSPNNQERHDIKTFKGTPEYTFFDNVSIGVSSTIKHIVFEYNYAFLCLVIILILVVWFTTKKLIPRIASFIPLVLWFMTWIPAEFDYFYGSCCVGPRAIITSIIGACALLSVCVCIYYIYGRSDKTIWLITMFVAAVVGRMVIGFANTGWQRYERTYTFLYFVMIILVTILACDIWDKLSYRKKQVLFGVIITMGNIGIFRNLVDLRII